MKEIFLLTKTLLKVQLVIQNKLMKVKQKALVEFYFLY